MRRIANNLLHPASIELLKYQSSAKLVRMLSSFRNPRRQLIAAVAVVLGFIWVSQAVVAIMFRESADPGKLMHWIPLGLLIYATWHGIKTVARSPVEPFEWTPAEDEWVRAAPLTRTQLISYRLASIFSSASAKALCFSLVMIPDLKFWPAGFCGMLFGLMFVDLIRICLELLFHGLSRRWQNVLRVAGIGIVSGMIIWTVSTCLRDGQSESAIASPAAIIFFKRLVSEVLGLASTPIGAIALAPFRPFAEIILTDRFTVVAFSNLLTCVAMVAGLTLTVYRLDRWTLAREKFRQAQMFVAQQTSRRLTDDVAVAPNRGKCQKIFIPIRWGGFGSVAWRQLLGAWHYRTTLAISLGVPVLLCCIPLLAKHEPFVMLLNIVGGIVFYSFLLLPSALMLDFRRDINRIVVLKSLPIGPLAMTLGQLAAPVLICSAFQWTVLLIATTLGNIIAWQAFVAALMLIPTNTLIFAIENFIFLLAPYRRNQEGIDVFLRTILTFTGKGVLFAVGLLFCLAWAFTAKALATSISDSPAATATLFALGIWIMTCLLASGFTWGIVRLYRRFDPSQDAPATS